MQKLIRDVRVIDGLGKAEEGQAVLIEGDSIKAFGPVSDFDGFAGSVLEHGCADATLMPGLIDCHVHLLYGGEGNPGKAVESMGEGEITVRGLENAVKTVRGGVTSVRDCGGKDYLEFAIRDACNAGRFDGPTIMAAGRMICMTGGHGNRFGRVADGVDEVVKAVREQIHAGSDLVKIMATGGVMTPGVNPEDAHYTAAEMAAGIAEGHRFHRTCASHAQGSEGILNAVRGGIDSIEHGIFLTDKCIEEMLAAGTYLVPTLAAVGNIVDSAAKGIPEYVIEKAVRVAATHRKSIQAFYEAGGKLAMGTDAGTPFNMHGENAQELRLMVENGITTMDAICISTANAANLMQMSDRGRIVAGAKADLLLVEGNPINDIAVVSDPANHRLVLKNGRKVAGTVAT